ncbi:hypothetical protein NFI96_029947, partial [Prochilodus magdalenae]
MSVPFKVRVLAVHVGITGHNDCSGVVPDCHGVTQNGSGSSSVTSPALILVETPNEPVCGGTVVIINSTITPNMTFTKTSQKFGQWADSRANTVFGLGFASEQQLTKFAEKFQEVKEAAKLARDKSQEKMETSSNHSQESGRETPSSNQVSSMNGTDDEKISHTPETTALQSENDRLKTAIEQRYVHSTPNHSDIRCRSGVTGRVGRIPGRPGNAVGHRKAHTRWDKLYTLDGKCSLGTGSGRVFAGDGVWQRESSLGTGCGRVFAGDGVWQRESSLGTGCGSESLRWGRGVAGRVFAGDGVWQRESSLGTGCGSESLRWGRGGAGRVFAGDGVWQGLRWGRGGAGRVFAGDGVGQGESSLGTGWGRESLRWGRGVAGSSLGTGCGRVFAGDGVGQGESSLGTGNSNAKKCETELQTLRESNARLLDALQEANSSVENWKTQAAACQEENTTLRNKIVELELQCKEVNQEKEKNAQLTLRVQQLEAELQDKDQELENLRKQAEIIPQLMAECESITAKLQVAEQSGKEARGKVATLQSEVEDSQQKHTHMKVELKKFMDVLEGKIDELHENFVGYWSNLTEDHVLRPLALELLGLLLILQRLIPSETKHLLAFTSPTPPTQ